MTRKLYWEDAYTSKFEAEVVRSEEGRVWLDQTAFYPTGGGQLNDTGTLAVDGKAYRVSDVKKDGEEVLHVLEGNERIGVGSRLQGTIDWERRYALMKHHTALHIVGAIVMKEHGGITTGGQITESKAHLDFDCPGLDRELSVKIVEKAGSVIADGREVSSRFITKEEALSIPDLIRTAPGRELINSLERVRIVDINGFDVQTDGGTHVRNTREIGRIALVGFENKGAHRKRIIISSAP